MVVEILGGGTSGSVAMGRKRKSAAREEGRGIGEEERMEDVIVGN